MESSPAFSIGLTPAFTGYMRMVAPDYLDTEYYFGNELTLNLEELVPPNPAPLVFAQAMTAPSKAKIGQFFGQAGVTQIMGTGILALRAFDCMGNRANNVKFEFIGGVPDGTFGWYFVNGVPVRASSATDSQGVGGFANIPAMGVEVRAISPDGRQFARIGVNMKADTLTFADVRPEGPYARSTDLVP